MIIGVDAGALSITDDRLKVGVYRVVSETLGAITDLDQKNSYHLFSFGPTSLMLRGVKEIVLPKAGWSKVWLPLYLRLFPVDVFLGFSQTLPFLNTSYNIGFVYDLGFLYHPEAYGTSAITLKNQTDDLVRRSDHIITISHATMADLIREYKIPEKKITVSYPGVDTVFSPVGKKFAGPKPYFLFVGSLNKAKSIPTLLEKFAPLRGYDLYLVGGDYWPDPKIDATIKALHLEDRVKKTGFIPDELLPIYYRGATAFVTTALQEGFCLPAAESMACGTPVVTLRQGALGEIVGKGGIVTTNLEEAMRKMTDKNIRVKYSKNAIIQAKKYRWEKFAEQILNCINHERKTA